MIKPAPLTRRQRQTLENLQAGRPSSFGLRGQSEHGGHERVRWSLRQRGLLDSSNQITRLGLDAIVEVAKP